MPDHTDAVRVDLRGARGARTTPARGSAPPPRAEVGGVELVVVAGIADGRGVEPGMAGGEVPVRLGDRRRARPDRPGRSPRSAARRRGAGPSAAPDRAAGRRARRRARRATGSGCRAGSASAASVSASTPCSSARAAAASITAVVVEPHLRRHAGLRVRQSDGLSKIPGGISRATAPFTPPTCRAGPRRPRTGRHRPCASPDRNTSDAVAHLHRERPSEREVPLLVERGPVAPQAALRAAPRAASASATAASRAVPDGHDPRREPHAQRLLGAHRASGEHEVEGPPLPDQPREAHGAAVDERHAPAPAEHAEHRVVGHHAQVAPQRELEATGDRVALDRRDHRLGQDPPRRAHRPVAVERDPVAPLPAGLGHRLEVGARAERAAGAGQHRDREVVVGLEALERMRRAHRRWAGRPRCGPRVGRW